MMRVIEIEMTHVPSTRCYVNRKLKITSTKANSKKTMSIKKKELGWM